MFGSALDEMIRRKQMIRNKRLVLAAAIASITALTTFSAQAFFGPLNAMRGWGGSLWGWDYPIEHITVEIIDQLAVTQPSESVGILLGGSKDRNDRAEIPPLRI